MKRHAIAATLAAGMSFPVFADEQGRSQQIYLPRLGELMVTTQLRHFKLWYAAKVRNWDLANYELTQINASFDDATKFYPNIPAADMTSMRQPADEVGKAIKAKYSAKFVKAFSSLTSACNSCHDAAGFGFISIREPRVSPIETSPFSDESFSPK
jgi:hypothetical protein